MTQAAPTAKRHLPIAAPDTTRADEQQKLYAHEDAAHEKRNWVRLSFDCNNHCTFCLDSNAHDGTMRDDREVRVQIVEGRKKGADRLILSGGEPTMNPLFLEYVRLGKRAGYRKVQTVTNGRMFAYPEFLSKALEHGLDEITFSLHGHTAKLHDALVGTPGAFVEEVEGLKAALATGRVIVNVDVVINKQNVRVLPEMLETFLEWGVREFDLLHVIPFGNAWTDARHHLFYDLDDPQIAAAIRRALDLSNRPDVHVWLNRFPPQYTEGYEHLIQDPYKLNDEVRGRREEYDRYLTLGRKLDCRQPERCPQCYLQNLCDTLDEVIDRRKSERVDVVEVREPAPRPGVLPRAGRLDVRAADLAAALRLAAVTEHDGVSLELDTWDGLDAALTSGPLAGAVRRVVARTADDAERLSRLPEPIEVAVWLCASTAPWLTARGELGARYVLVQPTYGRVTEAKAEDVDLPALFATLRGGFRVEGVAPCLSGRDASPQGSRLDAEMLGGDGRIDMTRYAARYAESRFFAKSVRCRDCAKTATCDGMHINWIRAHGFAKLRPIEG
ncbi:MAG: radical SAM protein [Polyangiaceae bacterium]|nr:radical SAM protein [Polyangiaceae bacterium]